MTKLGAKRKATLEEQHKEGGRRNATQVRRPTGRDLGDAHDFTGGTTRGGHIARLIRAPSLAMYSRVRSRTVRGHRPRT